MSATKKQHSATAHSLDVEHRKVWTIGSLCHIYSRSSAAWHRGQIVDIYEDKEGEWLKVRYNQTHIKHIQRCCADIKPIVKSTIVASSILNKNHKKMSLPSYLEHMRFKDKLLISGYLRLLIIKYHRMPKMPSVIRNLICKWFHCQCDISDFQLSDVLGRGNFGHVVSVQHRHTLRKYALKIVEKERVIELQQERAIENETRILQCIQGRNPFIISMLTRFEDTHCVYLVFELLPMGCEFFDLLRTYHRLNFAQCVFYAAQIVLIFEYLHAQHIIYRDLKPENIMYTSDGYIKLIDFGFAKQVDAADDGNNMVASTLCGTPEYLAPEIILNQGHSFGVDWWALGVLIFEMYCGFTPFEHDNMVQIYAQIMQHNEQNMQQIFCECIPNQEQHRNVEALKAMVAELLVSNPEKRAGHNSYKGDCDDIKNHAFFSSIDWHKIYHKTYTNTPKHSPIQSATYPSQPIDQQNALDLNVYKNNISTMQHLSPVLYDF